MTRYSPFEWFDDEAGATPITAARLNALEAGADADVPVVDIDATGTADSTTFLRGDGAWATPAGGGGPTDLDDLADVDTTGVSDGDVLTFDTASGDWVAAAPAGGGGAVDSVNGATGVVVLDQDDVLDGTTYKQYSATEKTKLAGVATGATANDTDANLKARANHTGTQLASTVSDFDAAARLAAKRESVFSQGGTLATGTGVFRLYNRSGVTRTIATVTASVGTQPTGASILVDVNISGTTIFTTQSNRPTIAVSTNEDESGAPDVTAWTSGSYLTIDIDQVGSTIAGANLVVTVVWS